MCTNNIGERGENLVRLRLLKYNIFNVYFLGDKAPIVDILLEINDKRKPYLGLAQIKSTEQENCYTENGRMKTPVPKEKLLSLINRPLPTYVIGADLNNEIIHIAPAFDKTINYSSIPPNLVLDNKYPEQYKANLEKLCNDITNYWDNMQVMPYKTSYQSSLT